MELMNYFDKRDLIEDEFFCKCLGLAASTVSGWLGPSSASSCCIPCLILLCLTFPCHAMQTCIALACFALPCIALSCLAVLCLAMPCSAW